MLENTETKNQDQKIWFKAKSYGYGWYPSNWKGWASLLLYVTALVAEFMEIDSDSHSVSDTLFSFAIQFLSLTALLYILCYITGEKPRWRWGKD